VHKVNLKESFALFSECWSPKIVGEINNEYVKLAKLAGKFDWHHHEHEDELFLVISGRLVNGVKNGRYRALKRGCRLLNERNRALS
jgi:mannose-6-phosphate isomerase-like protein (cupin superfamily)